MTQFFDDRGAELRDLFFESAQELLHTMNDAALHLEKTPGDAETVRTIRRAVHTLKGDAAACGCRELSELAHEFEDALAHESASSNARLAQVAFAAADIFEAMLKAYRKGAKVPSAAPLRKMIHALAAQPSGPAPRKRKKAAPVAQVSWSEYEQMGSQNAASQGKHVFHVTAHVDANCAMPIAARQLLLNGLQSVAEVLGVRPEGAASEACKRLDFLVATDKPAEVVAAKCKIPTVISQVAVEAVHTAKTKTADASEQHEVESAEHSDAAGPGDSDSELRAPSATSFTDNILRVSAERIDNVLNLVGELIIGKSMLQQALNEFARIYPKEAIRGKFADAMAFQARVLNDLQRSVMKIRMVPVGQLFRRFPRMVHDVAQQCEKQVELAISGQDTDLDKSILDAIAEPLTHLVRNAVSHGIESPEERARLGKPAIGTVQLDAYHQGNQVIVAVSDDGRGVDIPRVKAKAVEQGLITAEEAARLNETEALTLVFRPGFSTAEKITEIAGRGIGLDVVQSVLNRLKGTVEIETQPGLGTTFQLKLPLTLAIIKALLFRVEQRLYAISLNTVAEIARARESDLHQVDNYEVLQMRGQVLPVVRLGRPPADSELSGSEKIFVLVINVGERKLGLIVDALEGEEELVIKALDDQTVATDLVSGASILGDGRVVLILNLVAIVDRYAKSRPESAGGVSFGLLLSNTDRHRLAPQSQGVRQ